MLMHGKERSSSLPTSPVLSDGPVLVDAIEDIGSACRLHVAGIPFEVKEDELKCVFSQFGRVSRIKLAVDPIVLGRHRGTGFVEFSRPEAVDLALQVLQKAELDGHAIKLMRPHDWKQSLLAADASALKKLVYFSNISALVSDSDLKELFKAATRDRGFQIKSYSWIEVNEIKSRCMIVEVPNSAIAKSVIGAFSQRIILAQRVVFATGCIILDPLDLLFDDASPDPIVQDLSSDDKPMGIKVRLSNFPAADGSDARRELEEDVLEECQSITKGSVVSIEFDGSGFVVTVVDEAAAAQLVSVMDNRYFDGRVISASLLM